MGLLKKQRISELIDNLFSLTKNLRTQYQFVTTVSHKDKV